MCLLILIVSLVHLWWWLSGWCQESQFSSSYLRLTQLVMPWPNNHTSKCVWEKKEKRQKEEDCWLLWLTKTWKKEVTKDTTPQLLYKKCEQERNQYPISCSYLTTSGRKKHPSKQGSACVIFCYFETTTEGERRGARWKEAPAISTFFQTWKVYP